MRISHWIYLLFGAVGLGGCHGHGDGGGHSGSTEGQSLEELERKWGFDVS